MSPERHILSLKDMHHNSDHTPNSSSHAVSLKNHPRLKDMYHNTNSKHTDADGEVVGCSPANNRSTTTFTCLPILLPTHLAVAILPTKALAVPLHHLLKIGGGLGASEGKYIRNRWPLQLSLSLSSTFTHSF